MEYSQNVEEDSLMKAIKFYQSGLHRYMERNDESKMLHSLNKLSRFPIKVSHLKETGVGRTVNLLVKIEGRVGEEANSLINKWKQMVEKEKEDQESSDDASQNQTRYEENSEERYTNYKKSSSERKSDGDEDQDVKAKLQAEKENRSTERHRTSREHESNDHKRQESSDKYKHKSSHDRKENKHVVKSEREHSSRQDIDNKDGRSSIKKDRDNEKRREKDHDRTHKENGEKCKKGKDEHKEKDHKNYREKDKSSHREKERSEKEERTRKEMDRNERRERDEKQKEDKNHKEKDRKIDDDDKKDRDRKSSSSGKKDKTSSSKNCRTEISSESGTSFADALGMMEIPRKLKKSDKKDSTSSSRHQKCDTVLESPIQEKKSDRKQSSSSSRHNKAEKSPRLGDSIGMVGASKKERKSDKKEGSKHHKSEISSESGTSFEDALGKVETPKREKKAMKRENSALYNSEICSSSGTSFEAALGMIEVPRKKKKFADRQVDSSPSPGEDGSPVLPLPTVPLDKIDLNISSLLPSITPNYRPIRVLDSKHPINELETLNSFMTNKHQRTKIYSGNKSYYAKVPSLFDICVQLLQVHIDAIEGTGGVPYSILKPVLDKATPNQLLRLEYYNSYLTEDSDELWQLHCQKDFRREKRAECETWREMYTRCTEERETRLLTLTANIKQSREKSVPVKQTKIAYIDPPSRNTSRRQVKHLGSAPMAKAKVESMVRESKASSDVVVTHRVKAARGFSSSSSSAPSGSAVISSSQAKIKKVAPLMAKSLSAFKNRFKR